MRKDRFTEEQMVAILREVDRTSVAEAAKKNKVSEPTIYAWRKHFGQMDAVDAKRLRALEAENARLKKLLAEAALNIEVQASSIGFFVVSGRWPQSIAEVTQGLTRHLLPDGCNNRLVFAFADCKRGADTRITEASRDRR